MEDLSIDFEEEPDKQDLDSFSQILRQYNEAQVGPSGYKHLTIFIRNEAGAVVGGLTGATYWGWLYVDKLAVADSLRNRGLGKRLLENAEQTAIKRGCKFAYLDTFAFQALPFYEKLGYTIFGVLENFPEGKKRYFLQKKLDIGDTT